VRKAADRAAANIKSLRESVVLVIGESSTFTIFQLAGQPVSFGN
jgi:hypothetical protein